MKWLISSLLLLVLFAGVEKTLGWSQVLAPWALLSLPVALLAMGLMLLTYALRAARLWHYLRDHHAMRYWLCVRLMLWHNFANNLLPMRTGEASFPWLMKRYFGIGMAEATGTLLWFRLLDLQVILGLGLLAIGRHYLEAGLWYLLCVVLVLLPLLAVPGKALMQRILDRKNDGFVQVLNKILSSLPKDYSHLLISMAWSWVNWLTKLVLLSWLMLQFAEMPSLAAWLGVIAGDLTSVLPIHGPAGFGSYEAGVVAGSALTGQIDWQAVLSAAINVHLFILAVTLVGGLMAWLWSLLDAKPLNITRASEMDAEQGKES